MHGRVSGQLHCACRVFTVGVEPSSLHVWEANCRCLALRGATVTPGEGVLRGQASRRLCG